ncbi:protein TRI1 isoform X1 [Aplysia californica]|uniref:Protein TRI1 isoform X1 n=2 Tax=Aplysia californica TaxID=6500 RepID=A0ABM0JC16_APLCA|nr:protein TRI1 isoform X1 [Aplysia californica]
MADLRVEELRKAIKGILKGADLDNLSTKKVRKQLEQKFDTDLSERKKEIDKLVMEMINDEEEEEEEKDEEAAADKEDRTEANSDDEAEANEDQNGAASEEESEDEVPKKKAKKSTSSSSAKPKSAKRKSAGKADDSEDPVMSSIKQMDDEDLAKKLQEEESGLRRRAARRAAPQPKPKKKEKEKDPDQKKKKNSLYSRPCQLSEELAAVVGTNEMPRSDVVKTMWSIVKERNLQDPENKQYMLCDPQMEALFGVKRLRTFAMMKYLKKHIVDTHRS